MNSLEKTQECTVKESASYPASCVLGAATTVLRDMVSQTEHMQALIGKLMISGEPNTFETNLYDLQALDHITQNLEGLADFLEALADDTPAQWVYPNLAAVNVVKLETLANHLIGKTEICAPTNAHDNGDFDLF